MVKKEIAKPCPFCGYEHVIIKQNPRKLESDDYISIECYNCDAQVHFVKKYSIGETIECWNKRKY